MNADQLKKLTTDALGRLGGHVRRRPDSDREEPGSGAGVRCLAHEFAHELLHHPGDRPDSHDTRDFEAEAVAFIGGEAVGLDDADSRRDYVHRYRGALTPRASGQLASHANGVRRRSA
jgi:hypothetical protein